MPAKERPKYELPHRASEEDLIEEQERLVSYGETWYVLPTGQEIQFAHNAAQKPAELPARPGPERRLIELECLLRRSKEKKRALKLSDVRSSANGKRSDFTRKRLKAIRRRIAEYELEIKQLRIASNATAGRNAAKITLPHPETRGGTTAKGLKRGPKPDCEAASRVAEIVERVAPDGDWRSKLDEVCDALDEAKIPVPKRWRTKSPPWRMWCDGILERPVVIKAIQRRCDRGQRPSRSETSA